MADIVNIDQSAPLGKSEFSITIVKTFIWSIFNVKSVHEGQQNEVCIK